jgi:RNA recognition motif-containing protein
MWNWKYSFDEFCNHYAALPQVLQYRDVMMAGEWVEISDAQNPVINGTRISSYMRDLYNDEQERFFKSSRFKFIMAFAERHADVLGIPETTFDGACELGTAAPMFRAIHHYYTCKPVLNAEPTVEQVQSLAREFQDEF